MERSFYKKYFELEKDNWWFRVRRSLVYWILKKHITGVRNNLKILDFGCGSGYLVGELQKMGYDAYGSDMFKEAIEYGRSEGIQNLEIASKDQIWPLGATFDVILALDVIEHIEDDLGAIRGLKEVLNSGGFLVITVPAYQWLWGVQDEVAHHFRRYTLKSLLTLFHDHSDLSVIKKSYFNTFLFMPIAAVRLFSRLFNLKKRESDFDINNNFLNKVFHTLFNFEAKLLRYFNFPFGVSILLVIKKL